MSENSPLINSEGLQISTVVFEARVLRISVAV